MQPPVLASDRHYLSEFQERFNSEKKRVKGMENPRTQEDLNWQRQLFDHLLALIVNLDFFLRVYHTLKIFIALYKNAYPSLPKIDTRHWIRKTENLVG